MSGKRGVGGGSKKREKTMCLKGGKREGGRIERRGQRREGREVSKQRGGGSGKRARVSTKTERGGRGDGGKAEERGGGQRGNEGGRVKEAREREMR